MLFSKSRKAVPSRTSSSAPIRSKAFTVLDLAQSKMYGGKRFARTPSLSSKIPEPQASLAAGQRALQTKSFNTMVVALWPFLASMSPTSASYIAAAVTARLSTSAMLPLTVFWLKVDLQHLLASTVTLAIPRRSKTPALLVPRLSAKSSRAMIQVQNRRRSVVDQVLHASTLMQISALVKEFRLWEMEKVLISMMMDDENNT